MIDPAALGRLRSLILVCLNLGPSREVAAERQAALLVAVAQVLADLAEAAAPAAPAKAEPPQIRLPKRPPSKSFIEDVEWQKDRGLLLLRHLAARPGSAEVRAAVEEYLRDLDLEGKAVPPIGRLAAADPGPKDLPVAAAEPLDVRREGESRDLVTSRSTLRAEASAVVIEAGVRPGTARAGGLADVPRHSQLAAELGATAGRAGEGPESNPFDGTRGISGSKRVWWERARKASTA